LNRADEKIMNTDFVRRHAGTPHSWKNDCL